MLKVHKALWDSKELEDLRGPQEHKVPKEQLVARVRLDQQELKVLRELKGLQDILEE